MLQKKLNNSCRHLQVKIKPEEEAARVKKILIL